MLWHSHRIAQIEEFRKYETGMAWFPWVLSSVGWWGMRISLTVCPLCTEPVLSTSQRLSHLTLTTTLQSRCDYPELHTGKPRLQEVSMTKIPLIVSDRIRATIHVCLHTQSILVYIFEISFLNCKSNTCSL